MNLSEDQQKLMLELASDIKKTELINETIRDYLLERFAVDIENDPILFENKEPIMELLENTGNYLNDLVLKIKSMSGK